MATLAIGTKLKRRYEITQKLGEGAFGETYKAKDLDRPSQPICVVKRLKPQHTNPRILQFFEDEAKILERLGEHDQIPRLLAHFAENQELYIVQEFIEGHPLTDEIPLGQPLSEAMVQTLLREILEVLVVVHQQKVIHRDLKPENIMRRQSDNRVVLIDFGAVKQINSLVVNAQGRLTSTVVIGTPGYMPAEQGTGKPCLASDVYAVGKIGIEALTGVQALTNL